jgi:peptidoglycan/xylan/chitin deacetylase (PgdA/CDA1 family)
MSVPPDYFVYPRRKKGLDHDRFEHRYLEMTPAWDWPGGARLALWVTVHVEFFPMDMPREPFVPWGGVERPGGLSFWDYTMRDYGNRIGIFRILRALDQAGIRATIAMNAEVAERHPSLVAEFVRRDFEIAASSWNMGTLHHSGLAEADEKALVHRSVETLSRVAGRPVTGWHSPVFSESHRTPDLVAEEGLSYIADWHNDDLPYAMYTRAGDIVSMPLTYELSDRRVLFVQNQRLAEWEQQAKDAFDVLHAEALAGGRRLMSLSLTPWVIGQPYRIAALERVLAHIGRRPSVWAATGRDIAAAWAAGDTDGAR